MYICICHSVTDNDIRSCVESGARSMRDLRAQLSIATQCGKCACHAREVLKDSLGAPACAAMLNPVAG